MGRAVELGTWRKRLDFDLRIRFLVIPSYRNLFVEEKLGYNVTQKFGSNTVDGFYALAGCCMPTNGTDRGCGSDMTTRAHLSVEGWTAGAAPTRAACRASCSLGLGGRAVWLGHPPGGGSPLSAFRLSPRLGRDPRSLPGHSSKESAVAVLQDTFFWILLFDSAELQGFVLEESFVAINSQSISRRNLGNMGYRGTSTVFIARAVQERAGGA